MGGGNRDGKGEGGGGKGKECGGMKGSWWPEQW